MLGEKMSFLRKNELKTDRDQISLLRIGEFVLHEFNTDNSIEFKDFKGDGFKGMSNQKIMDLRFLYVFLAVKYTSEKYKNIGAFGNFSATFVTKILTRLDSFRLHKLELMEKVFLRRFPNIKPVENWEDKIYK